VQFLLDGATLGTEDTTSPYAIVWNTTGASNSSHLLEAVARDAAGNTTRSAGVHVTVSNAPSTGLAIDVIASGDQAVANTRVTSQTFSTSAANELLVAFVSADDITAGNTVTGVSGANLTWALVRRTNTRRGTSEIWRAFAPATLANVTVTATLAQSVASSIIVIGFKGADLSGTNGSGAIGAVASGSSAAGAPTAKLTTTRSGSWVFGVGNDYDRPIPRTLGPNQTLHHQYMPPVGDTYWVQGMTSATPQAGTSVTINDVAPTGDQYNLSICEILPAVQ